MASFLGVGPPYSPLLRTLEQGSDIHNVEKTESSLILRAKPGQNVEFDELAQQMMNHSDGFTAFGEPNGKGGYRAIYITPHE